MQTITRAILPRNQSPSVSNSQRGWSYKQIFDISTTFLNPLVETNSLYGKRTVGFFSLASHALQACEARALRAPKTLTPRFTDFFTHFEKKNRLFMFLNQMILDLFTREFSSIFSIWKNASAFPMAPAPPNSINTITAKALYDDGQHGARRTCLVCLSVIVFCFQR